MRPHGRFVPQSTINRRMANKDARIARELARRHGPLPPLSFPPVTVEVIDIGRKELPAVWNDDDERSDG